LPIKNSPLAPDKIPELSPIHGVRLGSVEAGIKYSGRKDLTVIHFDEVAAVAGVFTQSRCPSAPVDWCQQKLPAGTAQCVVINSGNANAFTGKKGRDAVEMTAASAASVFGCESSEVFLASTGVIGEPLDTTDFEQHLANAHAVASETGWREAAEAIMTTDTYPKLAQAVFLVGDKEYRINAIAKGSGMIAPDMATMLSFIITDYPASAADLQVMLREAVAPTFNAITVDSDTSTSDTVLLFSTTGTDASLIDLAETGTATFKKALMDICHQLAMLVVRDGEGAGKHVEIIVAGASSDSSAKKIAFAIANSPLVKTAIAGCDANWGRVVMAIGKAGEPADRDRLSISFGDILVAQAGERVEDYDEAKASAVMQQDFIPISVDLGLGEGRATVWTCDLTKEYISINGDYRS